MDVFMKQNFVITKLALAIYVESGTGEPVHKNRPYHGLVFQNGGRMRYSFDTGKVFTIKKGDILYLPEGSTYLVEDLSEVNEKGGCFAINFAIDEPLMQAPFVFHPTGSQHYLEYFREAEKAWRSSQAGDAMRCMSELYRILGTMKRSYAQGYVPQNKLQLIKPALDYIDENYTEKTISIAELARICKISESYLRQLFIKLCGATPKHFILDKKIKRACQLLRSQEYPVATVAQLCGYKDEYYFSREFSRIVGCAPSVYAQKR